MELKKLSCNPLATGKSQLQLSYSSMNHDAIQLFKSQPSSNLNLGQPRISKTVIDIHINKRTNSPKLKTIIEQRGLLSDGASNN